MTAFLVAALILNLLFWLNSSQVYARWAGVPPVPSERGALLMTLGDREFSYRFLATTLQNLGNVGRDMAPLKNYDYKQLGQWFDLLYKLDPVSNHVPHIAAYYFGATRVPKDAEVVAKYLSVVGADPGRERWRYLAQAAFLMQHRVNDQDKALEYAYKLQKMSQDGVEMPQWARQMPAFVLKNNGDRQAARELMERMLVTDKTSSWEEVNFMKLYLIEQLGVDPAEVEAIARLRGDAK